MARHCPTVRCDSVDILPLPPEQRGAVEMSLVGDPEALRYQRQVEALEKQKLIYADLLDFKT